MWDDSKSHVVGWRGSRRLDPPEGQMSGWEGAIGPGGGQMGGWGGRPDYPAGGPPPEPP
jgi:hypothetical protein